MPEQAPDEGRMSQIAPPLATWTLAEVADMLRCSQGFIRTKVRDGVVRPLRIGDQRQGQMRFRAEDVAALVAAVSPPGPEPDPEPPARPHGFHRRT